MHVLTDSIAAFVLFIHFVRSRELNATVIAFVLFSTRFKPTTVARYRLYRHLKLLNFNLLR